MSRNPSDHERGPRELQAAATVIGQHPIVADRDGASPRSRTVTIITQDPKMRAVMDLAARAARTDFPVFITGETGTGKDLLAQLVHSHSARVGRPFVAYNCSAVPATLVESELFGYVRGAFTGAFRDRRGALELAAGGTIFLDEIGDLQLEAQPKLLRFLEDGEVWPLGADKSHRVDVRVVAATNHDLGADLKAGLFREDLFFRLSVVLLEVPPLRSRPLDLPALVDHFVEVYAPLCGKAGTVVEVDTLDLLAGYPFRGNVRELQHLIARALMLMGNDNVLRPEYFPSTLGLRRGGTKLQERMDAFKRELISEAVTNEGSVARAAERLGMSSRNLNRVCERLGIDRAVGQKRPDAGSKRPS